MSADTGLDPMRNYDSFRASLRNFEWLRDVVPGASDIDLFIERRKHFLVVEMKPYFNGVLLPYGQHKALYALSLQPNTTVFLVGEEDGALHLARYNGAKAPDVVRRKGKHMVWWKSERFETVTVEGMKALVLEWWGVASEA